MARKSSFKSMLFGAIFGISLTSIFFLVFQDEIPEWLTNDETLRNMLLSLIPVASICNVATTIGMILWSLLGAQGRYRLASLIKFLAGWVRLHSMSPKSVFFAHTEARFPITFPPLRRL